jgi:hypothetical protein
MVARALRFWAQLSLEWDPDLHTACVVALLGLTLSVALAQQAGPDAVAWIVRLY